MTEIEGELAIMNAAYVVESGYNAAMRDEKLPRNALPAPQKGRGTAEP